MSEQRHEPSGATWASLTIDELARQQGAVVVSGPRDLKDDIWESDEELDAFLADLRSSRNASPS